MPEIIFPMSGSVFRMIFFIKKHNSMLNYFPNEQFFLPNDIPILPNGISKLPKSIFISRWNVLASQ